MIRKKTVFIGHFNNLNPNHFLSKLVSIWSFYQIKFPSIYTFHLFNGITVTKYAFCCFLNDRQGVLDDCLSNQHTIKLQ